MILKPCSDTLHVDTHGRYLCRHAQHNQDHDNDLHNNEPNNRMIPGLDNRDAHNSGWELRNDGWHIPD